MHGRHVHLVCWLLCALCISHAHCGVALRSALLLCVMECYVAHQAHTLPSLTLQCALLCGDVCCMPEAPFLFAGADFIWCNNLAFTPALNGRIATAITTFSKPGCVTASTVRFLSGTRSSGSRTLWLSETAFCLRHHVRCGAHHAAVFGGRGKEFKAEVPCRCSWTDSLQLVYWGRIKYVRVLLSLLSVADVDALEHMAHRMSKAAKETPSLPTKTHGFGLYVMERKGSKGVGNPTALMRKVCLLAVSMHAPLMMMVCGFCLLIDLCTQRATEWNSKTTEEQQAYHERVMAIKVSMSDAAQCTCFVAL